MTLTAKQHRVLVDLSAGDWRQGCDLAAPGVLVALQGRGFIRDDLSHGRVSEAYWTITPDGIAALERAAQ